MDAGCGIWRWGRGVVRISRNRVRIIEHFLDLKYGYHSLSLLRSLLNWVVVSESTR
jgi:hypothetical protein